MLNIDIRFYFAFAQVSETHFDELEYNVIFWAIILQ